MEKMMPRFVRAAAAVLSVVLAAACSGGGHSALPSTAASTAPAGGGTAQASVRVTIPAAATAYAKRDPQDVSPSTNSISISEGAAAAVIAPLTSGSPDCVNSGSSRVCTVRFGAVAAVNATITIKLYASSDGSGTPLSAQTGAQTIVTGAANQINVVLNGVVSSLSAVVQNPTMVVGTPGTTNVLVNGLDAAGNFILGPGVFADVNGNPITVTLTDSDTTGATHLAQTAATASAQIALTYNGAAISSAAVTASAPSIAPVVANLVLRTPGAALSAAQVNSALAATQSTFASLPHASLQSDLTALAAQMVSSGAYSSATVTPGGISATLPDGTMTILYADRQEDFARYYGTSAKLRHPAAVKGAGARRTLANDPVSPHQIALLTNNSDTLAFYPGDQLLESDAWANVGLPSATYGITNGNVTLENIAFLGGAGIDVLDLATHGSDAVYTNGTHFYAMLSETPVTDANNTKYAADLAAGLIFPSAPAVPVIPYAALPATYSFTMGYLTKYLKFNPGALFLNNSCFGQSPDVASADDAILKAAGIGRYFGWTKAVGGVDADQTDAFLLDRLVGEDGETPNGLAPLVAQRTPLQRPFPLDNVQAALSAETRTGPLGTQSTTYAVSDDGLTINAEYPPVSDGPAAKLTISDYGGETVPNTVIEYALPEITSLSTTETAANGTLTINGTFPAQAGTVAVTGSSGVTRLPVVSWTPTQITATLPADGAGATGSVNVQTADGLLTDAVPLTQWSGTLQYSESDDIDQLGGKDGSGSGSVAIAYSIVFRADVHPVVPVIDTTPAPQAFTFSNVEGDSTAQYTKYSGTFASDDGKSSAVFALGNSPALTPALPPLSPGTFEVRALTELAQPSPCNSGQPGLQGSTSNILCPITGIFGQEGTVTCTDTGSESVCNEPDAEELLNSYGVPDIDAGGLLEMTMDSKSYTVSITAQQVNYDSIFFEGDDAEFGFPAVANMTGSINAPKYPPSYGVSASGAARHVFAPSHAVKTAKAAKLSLDAARAKREL